MIICGQKLAILALVLSIDVLETALEFSVWHAAIFQDSIQKSGLPCCNQKNHVIFFLQTNQKQKYFWI